MKQTNFHITSAFCVILCFLLNSCSGGSRPDDGPITTIDVASGIGVKDKINLSELVEEVEFVRFEQSADAYFRNARSFSVGENYIMIADDGKNRVILFDRQGNFIRHIGSRGKGPGEYLDPWQAAMDPTENSIIVADGAIQKLIKYDLQGTLIKEIKTTDFAVGRFIDDIQFISENEFVLLMRRPFKEATGFANLLIFDSELNLVKKVLERSPSSSADPIQRSRHNIGLNRQRFYFWESQTDTLYTINDQGSATPTHRIVFDKATEAHQGILDPDNIEPESFLFSATEFEHYITLSGLNKGERFKVIYNTQNKSLKELEFVNDLFGGGEIYFRRYIPAIDRYVAWSRPSWFASENNLDSVRQSAVKFPQLRDEFVNMASDPNEDMNLLMILLRVK